jgi:dTDP-4-dehydrorhamnose 3,5-epimerase
LRHTAVPLAIPDVLHIVGRRAADDRGHFTETYRAREFAQLGIGAAFVQDNEAMSLAPGTLRGLHFQAPPHAQAKLVRVLSGAIFDVAVDLRRGSPTLRPKLGRRAARRGGRRPALRAHRALPRLADLESPFAWEPR